MKQSVTGIHHITAFAGDPQRNLDFYTQTLGLRLVKLTVNFDDPGTYHFYFGDAKGSPGTILTFFPWPMAMRGRHGAGQATLTTFSVPPGSLAYWQERLRQAGVSAERAAERPDGEALLLTDPDGLTLELRAHVGAEARAGWQEGGIPMEAAIRGFYGVTITVSGYERTARLLTETLGFRKVEETAEGRFRFAAGDGGAGTVLDVLCRPDAMRGAMGAGSVHHIAWRVPGDAAQQAIREEIAAAGYDVTPILDRQYFRSIYFREPGGALFEVATDSPGFATDETPETLGTGLKLPAWLEPNRARIERALPPISLPPRG